MIQVNERYGDAQRTAVALETATDAVVHPDHYEAARKRLDVVKPSVDLHADPNCPNDGRVYLVDREMMEFDW